MLNSATNCFDIVRIRLSLRLNCNRYGKSFLAQFIAPVSQMRAMKPNQIMAKYGYDLQVNVLIGCNEIFKIKNKPVPVLVK